MPDFVITSRDYPRFSVNLANCTREHADSVFDQLIIEPTVPSDLTLTDLTPPPPAVEPPAPPPPRSFLDRLLRRNRA